VLVHPGEAVKKGEVIVLLDATDFNLQQREAQSEVARLDALLRNQSRIVERNERLVQKNFISKNALEDASTQQMALKEQLEGARTRLATIAHTGAKTRIVAPIDGTVEKQIVSPGDFVKIGDPLLQIVSRQQLRVHLPFPENVAAQLTSGLTVRLSTPTTPTTVTATIREFKPLIGAGNRAIDVIADVLDQSGWQPGASVNGTVVVAVHENAVVVPEQSVVLRPAGEVVYAIHNDTATQRIVKTGLHQDGKIEIVQGLAAGEPVAVDGAAFLTDKAPVSVQQAPQS
jgi:membrane fusion protein (multidrug efflux system)